MFQIKICGITSPKDAQLAALAGADAVGLNFFPQSKRFVDLDSAQQIVKVLSPRVAKVGVFVNSAADEIQEIAEALGLDLIQLHGDEPPEAIVQLTARPVLRAFRWSADGFTDISDYLSQCRQLDGLPAAILLDARKPGEYGGTGEVVDWAAVAQSRQALSDLPLVLAGGLTPFNVTAAIEAVKPSAVDTASGVESAPGHKDPMLLRAFVSAAKKAFAGLAAG